MVKINGLMILINAMASRCRYKKLSEHIFWTKGMETTSSTC